MIKKQGQNYWYDVRVGGKRFRRSLKTDDYPLAVSRFKVELEKLEGEAKAKEVRFDDFARQYLEWAWSEKPASALREEQRLGRIKTYFKSLDIQYLADINPYHIEKLKATLKANGRSKATINRYLQILRGMFYKAEAWDIYKGKNPLKKVRFYKETSRVKALTPYQTKRVLAAARQISREPLSPLQKAFFDICNLSLNTGMRKGEILNLKWKDINGGEVSVKGKGEKRRIVPLNSIAEEIIKKQVQKNSYVFDVPNRIQHDLIRRTVNKMKKRARIKHFHFHTLRHTFATRLIEQGVDFVTLSEILGHSKLTTSLIYTHTDENRKRKAVESLV